MDENISFHNAAGHLLSGRLDLPSGVPRAYAIFAHCFTCTKSSIAAARIAKALAARGIGVLRFDFTGLGDSKGSFANDGFSGDVCDIVAAAQAMAAVGKPVALLVGHSFGGAAVLAAAGELEEVKAVATIAAPADVSHVLHQFAASVATIEARGAAQVMLAGRPFTIAKSFVDDARAHDLPARIHALRRPLLILHAPLDQTVGIDNAGQIFAAALHPKSFVSLDQADHLLTRREDALYAAEVISAWAARYLLAQATTVVAEHALATATPTDGGKFQTEVAAGGIRWFADEPANVGGLGSGPSPHEMVAAGLAACTAMTIKMYAEHKGIASAVRVVSVRYTKRDGQDLFVRRISFNEELPAEVRGRLLEIAEKCPVHKTLISSSLIETAEELLQATPENN